jgi:hypothetical protein
MENNSRIQTETVNITLMQTTYQKDEPIHIPEGHVVAMGIVVGGDTEGRIIDFTLLDNNNQVVRTADIRFSEKTNGGTFRDSLRPVDFRGGKTFQARLTTDKASSTIDVATQVLFVVENY